MLVSWLLVAASGASPVPWSLAPLVPPDLCRIADPPADTAAAKPTAQPAGKAPAPKPTGKPAAEKPAAKPGGPAAPPGTEVRLACTGSTGAVLDGFAKAWGGQVLDRQPDRVVGLRWAARGPDPVAVVAVHAEGAGVFRLETGRVPELDLRSDRCGVAHVEGKLPVQDGTAAFCLAVGGPPRLDGPIEVTTGTWRVVGSYRDGARVGPWRVTDAGGLPLADGEFAADRPTGTWTVRGAQVRAGEGQATSPLGFHELLSWPVESAAVDVIDAELEKGFVAVRVRWQAPASEPACETTLGDPRAGLGFAVLRPGVAEPASWWVVARRAPGDPCPTADEIAARLKEVRTGLAAHGLDAVLPPPAVSLAAGGSAFEVEGHRIAVQVQGQGQPAEGLGIAEIEPAELLARLPWLGPARSVEATLDATPVERWRTAPADRGAAPELSIPAVLADQGRWAVVYQLRVRDPEGEHHALLVGPVHSLGEAL